MQVYEHKLDRVLFEQDIIAPEDKPITVTFRAHFVRRPEIHVLNIAGGPRHPRNNASSRIPFITTAYPRAPWQMKITDEQGIVSADVPSAWQDVIERPWVIDDEKVGTLLVATPDYEAWESGWETPGAVLRYSTALAGQVNA